MRTRVAVVASRVAVVGVALLAASSLPAPAAPSGSRSAPGAVSLCIVEAVDDGDTLRCLGNRRIQLAGVDAPELPRSCRSSRRCAGSAAEKARDRLRLLSTGQILRCEQLPRRLTGGMSAWCWRSDGVQLNCALVRGRLATARASRANRLCANLDPRWMATSRSRARRAAR